MYSKETFNFKIAIILDGIFGILSEFFWKNMKNKEAFILEFFGFDPSLGLGRFSKFAGFDVSEKV